ncbi:MAG: hypothetical protein LBG57_10725 [Treponema sp.]|jgi:hypothetical protein|nr:hypothetical protein [Treponema sp.]
MNRFWTACLLAVLCLVSFSAGAAEAGTVDFSIRFFDRRIYYVESAPIYVQVTIANNSPSSYRFKLADERVFSVDFDIRTVSNRILEPSDSLIRKRTQSQRIFFREIAVESGESFSFIEDLRDYADFSRPGSFVVQARVYPELYRPAESGTGAAAARPAATATAGTAALNVSAPGLAVPFLESNRLSLSVRPPAIPGPGGIPLEMDVETNAVLVRERLPPDQVVEYMLLARQRSQWERFFLYLDLEAMITEDGVRRRRWLAEGEEGRRRMLAQYRQELQNSVVDGDISVMPAEFTMERTQYNNTEGTVTVLEKFRYENFTELKRYTYYLRQKDNIWTIANYSVVNLGTE